MPQEILRLRGKKALANHIINGIQDVYRLQGVSINDKHIEVIVRQMLRNVEVTDPGESDLVKGEQVSMETLAEVNDELELNGKQCAQSDAVLLGITRAALATDSFISAASFQETTRVLD